MTVVRNWPGIPAELIILSDYLDNHDIIYTIKEDILFHGWQIIVYDKEGVIQWDALCNDISYGHTDGLLEICGSIVNPAIDGDIVVGYLTADDIIKRLENA